MVLSDAVYKERNAVDEKFFVIYDSFKANFNTQPLTGKFYSKYECIEENYEGQYLEAIRLKYYHGPKQKYPRPVTTNQMYGWYPVVEEKDPKYCFPMKESPYTRITMDLKKMDKYEPKFTGLPFSLQ